MVFRGCRLEKMWEDKRRINCVGKADLIMTLPPLIRARWNGEAFVPIGNWPVAWCHDNLRPGEVVAFEVERERTMRSHRHQFAWINTAWANMPESIMDRPWAASPETLRKHALIATGHCNVEVIAAGSKAAAQRVAAFVTAVGNKAHGYCLTSVRGSTVTCYTPHSQSMKAMGKARFQKSKQDVLDWIAAELGVEPEELERTEGCP